MSAQLRLTSPELLQAAMIGAMRHIAALKRNLPDRHGFNGLGWSEHIEGACGEMAVARALGRYYSSSVNTFKAEGDVGEIQVRTRSRHDYELIVRADDRDLDVFVCVTGRAPAFVVRGWIRGVEAKRPEWLQTHGDREPAFFVPHSALLPIDQLQHHAKHNGADARPTQCEQCDTRTREIEYSTPAQGWVCLSCHIQADGQRQ